MKKPLLIVMALFFVLTSCSLSVVATLRPDRQVDIIYSGEVKPKVASLLQAFGGATQAESEPLISATSVTASLEKIPELSSIMTKNLDPQGLEGKLSITNPEKLSARFSFMDQTFGTDESVFNLRITRESAPELLALFSPEVRDYLDALMAPISSGETLTLTEYRSLLTSVYGKTIAQEIETSHVSLEIRVPGRVLRVVGGTSSGSRAVFVIPLQDLLVLQKPLLYQIAWK